MRSGNGLGAERHAGFTESCGIMQYFGGNISSGGGGGGAGGGEEKEGGDFQPSDAEVGSS